MPSVLWTKAARQLRATLGLGLAVAALTGAGTGTTIGLVAGAEILGELRDHSLRDLRAADVEANLDPTEPASVARILGGLGPQESRLLVRAILALPDGHRLSALAIYQPARRLAVNDLALVAGQALDAADPSGVVIERSLARHHGLAPGDVIVLDPDTAPRRLRVRGVVVSSEFLLPSADPDQIVPAKGSLGVVFLPWEAAAQSPVGPLVNHVAVRASAAADEGTLTRVLGGLPLGPDGVRGQRARFDLRLLADDLKTVRSLGWAGGALFLLLTAAFSAGIMRRLLAPWRAEARVFRALGVPRAAVGLAFAAEIAVLAAAAALVSVPSSALVGAAVAEAYRQTMGLPGEPILMAAPFAAQAAWLAIGAVALAALAALVPAPPPARPGGLARRLGGLPMVARLALRGLWRRPAGALTQAVLLAMAAGLPAGFAAFSASWDGWARASLASEPWDAAVTFRGPLPLSAVPRPPDLTVVPYLAANVRLETPGRPAVELRIWGLAPTAKEGLHPGGLMIPERVARSYGLRLGDTVVLHHGPRHATLTVAALTRDVSFDTAYATWEDAARLTGAARATGALIKGAAPALVVLANDELTASLVTKPALTERVVEYLRDIRRLADLGVPLSLALGVLLAVAAVRSAIEARAAEAHLLATLGFSVREVAAIVAGEMIVLGIGAALLTAPAAWAAAALLDATVAAVFFSVPIRLSLAGLALSAGPIFVAAALAVGLRLRRNGRRAGSSDAALAALAAMALGATLLFLAPPVFAGEPPPPTVAQLLKDAREGSALASAGFKARVRLTTTRPGRVLVRRLELWVAADGRTLRLRVIDPADLRGTGILVERTSDGVRRTLYVPELHRSRPLPAGQALDSLLSTDLRYADLELLDDSLYDFTLDPSSDGAARDAWRLSGRARSSAAPYGAVDVLIDRRSRAPMQIRAWDRAGQLAQTIAALDLDGPAEGRRRIVKARAGATEIVVEQMSAQAPDPSDLTRAALEDAGP